MSTPDDPWASVAVLAEPTRRRVFDAVREARAPVTREAVAAAVGINARLAAFHLDRLAAAGLLTVGYARPPGRSGPGAGRPAKRYAAASVELELSLPARHYDLVARILAAGIARSPQDADHSARKVARGEGQRAGEEQRPAGRARSADSLASAKQALQRLGYEPVEEPGSVVRLRNCPFHDVVDVAPALVCGLNQELVTGLLEGLGVDKQCTARLDGTAPDCCVTVTARARRSGVALRKASGDVEG